MSDSEVITQDLSFEEKPKGCAQYQAPAPWLSVLLCTTGNSLEEGADIDEHGADDRSFCMRACDVDGGLIGVCGAPGNAIHCQWPGRDRFGEAVTQTV